MQSEIVIIGGGVVGLACASECSRAGFSTLLVERHESFGHETSSRNSEVIHSGIYYPTGSLKARLCVTANHNIYGECEKSGVWSNRLGKLIVAVSADELPELEKLYHRGIENGVEGLRILDQTEVKKAEPYINAIAAIFLPSTGIIDSHQLMKAYLIDAQSHGADTAFGIEYLGCEHHNGRYQLRLKDITGDKVEVETRVIVNAAGLWSDKVAATFGIDLDAAGYRMHHNRGHYFTVSSTKSKLVSHLVYPMPHQHLVSIGVHITIDKAGQVKLGPDTEYLDPSIPEDQWYKFDESRKSRFFDAVRKYFPALEDHDLSPGQVGVRPKLAGSENTIKDFIISEETDKGLPGIINLIGIESPGLTCSREIAREVVSRIQK
jgi:L-2-hydroxyglutarate oxidase LhgO